jgi:hypothetical protein
VVGLNHSTWSVPVAADRSTVTEPPSGRYTKYYAACEGGEPALLRRRVEESDLEAPFDGDAVLHIRRGQ